MADRRKKNVGEWLELSVGSIVEYDPADGFPNINRRSGIDRRKVDLLGEARGLTDWEDFHHDMNQLIRAIFKAIRLILQVMERRR